jgi:pimeloyl-ACP methyl ester carboxylesterase
VALTYREAGQGRPVVLIHGFPIDGRLFDAQLSAAAAGRISARVIAIDLPGFGGAPFPAPGWAAEPEVMRVEELAEEVCSLIIDQGWQKPVVGGVAIGAYIAIDFAAFHAEMVGGLALFAPRAAPDNPAKASDRERVARLALEQGSEAVAEELHALPLGPQADASVKARMRSMIAAADSRAIAALVRGIAVRPDPALVLPGIEVPALVVAGDADPFSPLADVRRAAELLPRGELVVLQGIGHMAPIEAPLAVTRAMASFLADLQ